MGSFDLYDTLKNFVDKVFIFTGYSYRQTNPYMTGIYS